MRSYRICYWLGHCFPNKRPSPGFALDVNPWALVDGMCWVLGVHANLREGLAKIPLWQAGQAALSRCLAAWPSQGYFAGEFSVVLYVISCSRPIRGAPIRGSLRLVIISADLQGVHVHTQ